MSNKRADNTKKLIIRSLLTARTGLVDDEWTVLIFHRKCLSHLFRLPEPLFPFQLLLWMVRVEVAKGGAGAGGYVQE